MIKATMKDGYAVEFTPTNYGDHRATVKYGDMVVAERRGTSWWWSVRWARHKVREHRRAMKKIARNL